MIVFKVGERYIIRQNIDGIKEFSCKVLEYDNSNGLLRINHSGIEKIINTASCNFIEAELDKSSNDVKKLYNLMRRSGPDDEDPPI